MVMEHFVVASAYTAAYPDPIAFEAGEPVEVQKHDDEFPGWYWCRSGAGREGWVHRSCLEREMGMTQGLRNYSARELTVDTGAKGAVLERLDGWLYVELQDGSRGWLPESQVVIAR